MKKSIFALLFVACSTALFAQVDSSDDYVKNFLTIPQIKVSSVVDGTLFSNANLRKNTPFVIMFFTPDCDHCQQQTKELLAYKNELKGIQVLMVSGAPFKTIKDFYGAFQLTSMKNVTVAQDVNLKLTSIYRVRTYPSLFVYDNRGNLAKAFVGNIGIPAILNAVK